MTSLAEYPFQGHYFSLGSLRLHYLDEGQGSPLLMVHGNPTWSYYFRRVVAKLRNTRRCIVPDHIGCGLSDKPSDEGYRYTLEQRVDDLGRLIDGVGMQKVDILAHDWGGMIAMAWATRHPERVGKLAMMNTAAFTNPRDQRIPWTLRLARDTSMGALLVRGLNAFSRGAVQWAVKKPMSAEIARGYLAPYDSWSNRRAVLRFVQDIPLGPQDPAFQVVQETEDHLPRLKDKKLLLLWGMKDFVFTPAFLSRWRHFFPEASVVEYPQAGHFVLEDEAESVVSNLNEFFS